MHGSRRLPLFGILIAAAVLFVGAASSSLAVAQEPNTEAADDPPHHWLAIDLGLGFALGGDDLLEVEFDTGDDTTLSAGNGAVINVGATLTPLWIGRVGLGASFDLGLKYAGIEASNGSASFTRFPLVVAARALVRIADGWSALVSGGLHYDLSASLSGDGVLDGIDLDSDSALGWTGHAGAFYEDHPLGLELTLGYTSLEYELGASEVDASSFGLFAAFHYFVL